MNDDRPFSLVAGGSGYFGSLLVNLLHRKGERVRVFDLNDPGDGSGRAGIPAR